MLGCHHEAAVSRKNETYPEIVHEEIEAGADVSNEVKVLHRIDHHLHHKTDTNKGDAADLQFEINEENGPNRQDRGIGIRAIEIDRIAIRDQIRVTERETIINVEVEATIAEINV